MSVLKIKDEKGNIIDIPAFKGPKGEKGEKGDAVNVDEKYNPESENAQSGKAVASAIKNKLDKIDINDAKAASGDIAATFYGKDIIEGVMKDVLLKGSWNPTKNTVVLRDAAGRIKIGFPAGNDDAANKSYVDSKVQEVASNDIYFTDASAKFQLEGTSLSFAWTGNSKYSIWLTDKGGNKITSLSGNAISEYEAQMMATIIPSNAITYEGKVGWMAFYLYFKEFQLMNPKLYGFGKFFIPADIAEDGSLVFPELYYESNDPDTFSVWEIGK